MPSSIHTTKNLETKKSRDLSVNEREDFLDSDDSDYSGDSEDLAPMRETDDFLQRSNSDVIKDEIAAQEYEASSLVKEELD